MASHMNCRRPEISARCASERRTSLRSPVVQAAEMCRARGMSFRDDLEAHLLHGWVISTPELFLMARAVPRGAKVTDLDAVYSTEECDAWFIWLGVGPAAR